MISILILVSGFLFLFFLFGCRYFDTFSCNHQVDAAAGGQFVPEGITNLVQPFMNKQHKQSMMAGTTPIQKRSPTALRDTGVAVNASVPRLSLFDISTRSYVQSPNKTFWYNNSDYYIPIRKSRVVLTDVLRFEDDSSNCSITRCKSKNCKTCDILITDNTFTSNFTNKTYQTLSHENLTCRSSNLVYAINCTLCGLVYVGETGGRLNIRLNGHRSNINKSSDQLIYQHFNQPDHSILTMKVHIIEKIYHASNNSKLSTPFRRQREEFWIKELGTASPYGCNDKIDSVGNLTSPRCSELNVLNLFNVSVRRRRSHGHRHYNCPGSHKVSFDELVPYVNAPLGIHHIRTKLFSLPFSSLHKFHQCCLDKPISRTFSPEHRLVSIVSDIANNRLFKPVLINQNTSTSRIFLKLKFENKGIDAINISNLFRNKGVTSKIPTYFQHRDSPLISYTYTKPVASKLFNYKQALKHLNVHDFKANPPPCTCSSSPFLYSPAGHIITGDLNIVQNDLLKDLLYKGPKYREPRPFSWKHNFKIVMDAVENYARRWAHHEDAEVDSLSEWVKAIRTCIRNRIQKLKGSMNNKPISVLEDPTVSKYLSDFHEKFVLVPADKASNNIVVICKTYYYQCLIEELGLFDTCGNPTYTPVTQSKKEILDNHNSVLHSFHIPVSQKDMEIPYLYWIPKLHKNPYKQRYIAGSATCSTKPLSQILTKLLTTVKEGIHKYCDIAYDHSGINQMWILKNSKELLQSLKSRSLTTVSHISTYDFSTLYTTIPHSKLKARLRDLIHQAFFYKNGRRRYRYLVVNWNSVYFVKEHTDCSTKYDEHEVIAMLEFLIDNIFVQFGGEIFQQTVGIPMGTNCAPLLADLFLYSYESEFIQKLIKRGKKKVAGSFNFTYRYIDDVLSLNNPQFGTYLHQIYPDELEIKDTSDTPNSSSYLDILLTTDCNQKLRTRLYDKRDDFNFPIINFPFISSNIPAAPAYGVYVSQLIRYARTCSAYQDFVVRSKNLTSKLLDQGYTASKLMSSFKKFYGRHYDLTTQYDVSVTKMLIDIVTL